MQTVPRHRSVLGRFTLGEDVRASTRPASVNTKRRDVRLVSRGANRASSLLTAVEIVALDSVSARSHGQHPQTVLGKPTDIELRAARLLVMFVASGFPPVVMDQPQRPLPASS